MKKITFGSALKHLSETMDRVGADHEPVIITRRNAKPVVIISLEDYRSLEETAYLLGGPVNAARLAESISQANAGKARERRLLE